MSKKMYKMDSGEWLNSDVTEGEGRGLVKFSTKSWTGREDRMTIRVVRSDKKMKAVTIRQLGEPILEISESRLDFPIGGGDKQIMITTNAASLNALITSDYAVKSNIKAFTTASGLNIQVNDIKLNYGFPGDPGLEGVFQVSLIVSMPNNDGGDEVNENITINGTLIPITQPGKIVPYIKFDKEFEEISGDDTLTTLKISSNLDKYKIEIVECDEEKSIDLTLDKYNINLDKYGSTETFNISTKPNNLPWRIKK